MKSSLAVSAALAVLVTAVSAAAAGDGTATLTLSTKKTHALTSMQVAGTFAPDAEGKQRILTSVTFVMPVGSKFNVNAVTQCPGDAQTLADEDREPRDVCPAESLIGTGTANVLLGGNDTVFDVEVFNQAAGPTLVLSINDKGAYVVDGHVNAHRIMFPLGLAEQLQAATKSFDITFKALGTKKKPLISTPSSCPRKKVWKGGLEAEVSGGGKLKIPATAPCKKPRKKG